MKEFLASKDEDEAGRCWRELDVSFYGHQLVFAILVAAFEFPAKSEQLMLLIKRFEKSGEVSQVCQDSSLCRRLALSLSQMASVM